VCICVLYYCHRVATQLQLTNIPYHTQRCKTKQEEFNRKYSGSILLFSVHLHIPLICVFIIGSNCTEFCLHWHRVLAVCFRFVQFCKQYYLMTNPWIYQSDFNNMKQLFSSWTQHNFIAKFYKIFIGFLMKICKHLITFLISLCYFIIMFIFFMFCWPCILV